MKNIIFLFFYFFSHLKKSFGQSTSISTSSISDLCEVNLDCPVSFCCKEQKCVEFSLCKYDNFAVYLTVGLTAFGVILISLILYLISRRKTMRAMAELQERGIIKDEVCTESMLKSEIIEDLKENSGYNDKMKLEIVKDNEINDNDNNFIFYNNILLEK